MAEKKFLKANAAQDEATANLAAESEKLKPIEEEEDRLKEKLDSNRKELMSVQVDFL